MTIRPASPSTCRSRSRRRPIIFGCWREAGIISQRYRGTAILNCLRDEEVAERFPGLLDAVLAAEGSEVQGTTATCRRSPTLTAIVEPRQTEGFE